MPCFQSRCTKETKTEHFWGMMIALPAHFSNFEAETYNTTKYNLKKSFLVYTDASEVAVGRVLGQIQEVYSDVILEKAEKNYSTAEREALAAICTIKELKFLCLLIFIHR